MKSPRDERSTKQVLRRIRGEYLEMPGLRLTPEQACRLLARDRDACERLLGVLVGAGFLRRLGHDTYVRQTEGPARVPPDRDGNDDQHR